MSVLNCLVVFSCARNITAFCHHILRLIKLAVLADNDISVKPSYRLMSIQNCRFCNQEVKKYCSSFNWDKIMKRLFMRSLDLHSSLLLQTVADINKQFNATYVSLKLYLLIKFFVCILHLIFEPLDVNIDIVLLQRHKFSSLNLKKVIFHALLFLSRHWVKHSGFNYYDNNVQQCLSPVSFIIYFLDLMLQLGINMVTPLPERMIG